MNKIQRKASAKALNLLLIDICSMPERYHEQKDLILHLQSQQLIAEYHNEDLGIYRSSINTLKRICLECTDIQYAHIERNRRLAIEALNTFRKKADGKRISSKLRTEQLMRKLRTDNLHLKEDLMLMTRALENSLNLARNMSASNLDIMIKEICDKEIRCILDSLSLRRHGFFTDGATDGD